jgi:spermidine synthase
LEARSTVEIAEAGRVGSPAMGRRQTPIWLGPAFFASGFSALVYQVVWQRVLFAAFGINIEAVTVVVTAFLLGLGLGSLFGGYLSRNPRCPPLLAFSFLEFSVAAYGAVSVPLFRAVGDYTATWSGNATGALTFALVLAPTLLMGATLPLLVSFVVRESGVVGRSVGTMYFVNTAGSSLAAIAAALVLMGGLGEIGSVRLAASINAAVGTFVLTRHLARRGNA